MCVFTQVYFQQLPLLLTCGLPPIYLQFLKNISVGLDSHSNQVSLAMLANSVSFCKALQHILSNRSCNMLLTILLGFDEQKEDMFC